MCRIRFARLHAALHGRYQERYGFDRTKRDNLNPAIGLSLSESILPHALSLRVTLKSWPNGIWDFP
jgi:hypothetical protein